MELRGLNITVFDLEIKMPIGGPGGCGWKDYDKMGISVGCSYNFRDNEYKVFMDDNLDELAKQIDDSVLVVGFNTLGFDVPLLEKTLNIEINKEKHYDVLFHSRESSGMGNFTPGFKLDNHLAGTFGVEFMKTGDGASAPIWYQEKKIGKLTTYCLDDVKREAKLFQFLWNNGFVKLDTHGQINIKRMPQDFLKAITGEQLPLIAEGV